eukprot:2665984-Alexandrium_andersonii.AAC.1
MQSASWPRSRRWLCVVAVFFRLSLCGFHALEITCVWWKIVHLRLEPSGNWGGTVRSWSNDLRLVVHEIASGSRDGE